MAQITSVTTLPKRKVSVIAPLACPVIFKYSLVLVLLKTVSLFSCLDLSFFYRFKGSKSFLSKLGVGVFLIKLHLLFYCLSLLSFILRHEHMLWKAFNILLTLVLLASVAILSMREVVVLTLATLPSSLWELELCCLSFWIDLQGLWVYSLCHFVAVSMLLFLLHDNIVIWVIGIVFVGENRTESILSVILNLLYCESGTFTYLMINLFVRFLILLFNIFFIFLLLINLLV